MGVSNIAVASQDKSNLINVWREIIGKQSGGPQAAKIESRGAGGAAMLT